VTTCTNGYCEQPAVARFVTADTMTGKPAFAIVRPTSSTNPMGAPVCVDCLHHALDVMLMRAAA
jgi:hypothetical protein